MNSQKIAEVGVPLADTFITLSDGTTKLINETLIGDHVLSYTLHPMKFFRRQFKKFLFIMLMNMLNYMLAKLYWM